MKVDATLIETTARKFNTFLMYFHGPSARAHHVMLAVGHDSEIASYFSTIHRLEERKILVTDGTFPFLSISSLLFEDLTHPIAFRNDRRSFSH